MHGPVPRPRRFIAARVKKAGLIAAITVLAVIAMAGAYDYVNSTKQGHQWLIRWGFEYPADCG